MFFSTYIFLKFARYFVFMIKNDVMKRAVVAGASYAMKYKERKPSASESEVISYVTDNLDKIVDDIKEND